MPSASSLATWFDHELLSTGPTPGTLTDYYYQMSAGNLILLGDYYPELISVSCSQSTSYQAVLDGINQKTSAYNSFKTANFQTGAINNSTPLSDFDYWGNEGQQGVLKSNSQNTTIDAIQIVWRNYSAPSGCEEGNGMSAVFSSSSFLRQNSNSANNYSVKVGSRFISCAGKAGPFTGEFMHSLFGHNNWHSGNNGGEPETRTFLHASNTYSLTSYSFVGGLVNAWDRNHLSWHGWKTNVGGTRKTNLISAKTSTQNEVATDFAINTTFPDGNEFILRDFVTYGDAIRIKLPYINWVSDGDVKNQYLWIENHQKQSVFDKSRWENPSDPNYCKEPWSKGIYAYVQVGKDITEATNTTDLYNDNYINNLQKPNTLGSWFFALTAEGNYDYKYRYDLAGNSSANCVWSNNYLPIEKNHTETKPNPFTGMNDLFHYVDYNDDGILKSGDTHQPWTAEMVNGQVEFHAYAGGDGEDAFKCGTCPKKILSLGTNPAPIPVYTYYFANPGYDNAISGNASWENRTIYLNGISVEILGENVDGNGAVKVKVRFDDYEIQNDVRWCGNIVLNPNYQNPNTSNYALNLMPGKTILLDRGKSPTQHIGVKDANNNFIVGSDGRKIFTQPTQFTVLPNALFHTEENSTVIVDNGSTFTLQSGSRLEIHGQMTVRNGSKLIVEDGAEVYLHHTAKLYIENGAEMIINNNNASKIITLGNPALGNNAEWRIDGKLTYNSTLDFTFNGSGFISFGVGNQLVFPNNNKFKLNGTGKTDLVMWLYNGATVSFNGNEIDLQNGKIGYGSNSSFNVSNGIVLLKNLSFAGSLTATGFYGNALTSFRIETSDINTFLTGIRLENFTPMARVLACNFTNCYTAVKASYLDAMQFASLSVQAFNYGYDLDNIRTITANGNQISSCDVGVKLNEVQGYHMIGGKIYDILWAAGITANNSQIFMRNGAIIEGAHTEGYNQYAIGIDIIGAAPTVGSPSYKSMVTMGDQGCGSIVNCSLAVKGTNTLMNIDAVQHAINRNTPNDVRPNRFDGNLKALDLCYNISLAAFIPNEILAKGNFWKYYISGNSALQGISPSANYFSVKKRTNGTDCSQNISVDYSFWSECLYSQILTGCMNCSGTSTGQPGNSGNAGGGQIAPPGGGGVPEECPAKIRVVIGGGEKTIDHAFREANQQFVMADEIQTRANFKEISELQLEKNNAGDIIICDINDPSCNNGGGGPPKEKISNPCAQLVMVSKALYEGFAQVQARKANTEESEAGNQPQQNLNFGLPASDPIAIGFRLNIYPNPNDGSMTVEYNLQQEETGKFIIHDVTGRKISEYNLQPENNIMLLNETQLSDGIFYYSVIINDNPVKIGKLSIIK